MSELGERLDALRTEVDDLNRSIADCESRLGTTRAAYGATSDRLVRATQGLVDAGGAALGGFEPQAHLNAFQAALQARAAAFNAELDDVVSSAEDLPRRISEMASEQTLAQVGGIVARMREELLQRAGDVAVEVAATLANEALIEPARDLAEEVDDARETLTEKAEETVERFEATGERLSELADNFKEAMEEAGDGLKDAWHSRGEVLDELLESHALNFVSRGEALVARYEAMRGQVLTIFAALSALRTELSELTADNSGPAGDVAEALGAATEIFESL